MGYEIFKCLPSTNCAIRCLTNFFLIFARGQPFHTNFSLSPTLPLYVPEYNQFKSCSTLCHLHALNAIYQNALRKWRKNIAAVVHWKVKFFLGNN